MTTTFLTYRGTVHQWQCDHMGHMNVMWYVGKFDEATWYLAAMMGMTAQYLKDAKRGMAAVDQRIAYRREALPGDVVTIRTAIIEAEERALRTRDAPRRSGRFASHHGRHRSPYRRSGAQGDGVR